MTNKGTRTAPPKSSTGKQQPTTAGVDDRSDRFEAEPAPAQGRSFLPRAVRRRWASILGVISVLGLAAVWELISRQAIIDPFFISSPSEIATTAYGMFSSGEIFPHLRVSAYEAVLGFAAAVVVGVPLGLVIGRFATVRAMSEPYIIAMYSTPTVAFLPLLILWLGIGLAAKVFLIFIGGVFMVVVNTAAGVRSVDPNRIETARSFLASELRIFFDVILPSSVGYITAGIRLAIGRVLITMFVAEMFMANVGIGYLITQAGMQFRTADMFVGIFILAITGVVLSESLRWLEDHKLARFR